MLGVGNVTFYQHLGMGEHVLFQSEGVGHVFLIHHISHWSGLPIPPPPILFDQSLMRQNKYRNQDDPTASYLPHLLCVRICSRCIGDLKLNKSVKLETIYAKSFPQGQCCQVGRIIRADDQPRSQGLSSSCPLERERGGGGGEGRRETLGTRLADD